jgi:integrase
LIPAQPDVQIDVDTSSGVVPAIGRVHERDTLMPHLSPQTLTEAEQRRLRRATAAHPLDGLIFSLALGTGQRLAELVGLDVGNVYFPDGAPRGRVRLRREIAKRHRAGDVFLPDALVPKLGTVKISV